MNKTRLILARDLRNWIKKVKSSLFVSEWIRLGLLFWLSTGIPENYFEFSQTSKMELFTELVGGFKPLTTFSKVWS